MRFAPIIAYDEECRCWQVVGVMAANRNGNVRIKVAAHDPLVRRVPGYQMIERYNNDFADGEVTFYRRNPDEMSSHMERLKTDHPNFIECYGAELASQGNWIRLGQVRRIKGDRIDQRIDALLDDVRVRASRNQ